VQRLEHRRPLKLVEGALQPESLALGAFDEGDDALDQASRPLTYVNEGRIGFEQLPV
jgi:hypothetical protein